MLNPFPPENFAENRAAFWSKKRKFTAKPIDGNAHSPNFVARGRHDGRDPFVQRICWRILGMRRKQNFEIVFGFKRNTAVLTFSFRFLSTALPSISLSFFFSFPGLCVGGKSFWNTFPEPEFDQYNFFRLPFMKFSTKNKYFRKGGVRVRKKQETPYVKQAKFMIKHLSLLRINFSTLFPTFSFAS